MPDETGLVAHPLGSLRIRQRVVPLNRTITRFDAGIPDAPMFALGLRRPDGTIVDLEPSLFEPFARAQFEDLDDATKLSAPRSIRCRLASSWAVACSSRPRAARTIDATAYEQHTVDVDETAPVPGQEYRMPADEVDRLVVTGAVAARRRELNPVVAVADPVEVRPMMFVVARVDTMSAAAAGQPVTFDEATRLLREQERVRPAMAGLLSVVGAHEVLG